MTLKSNQPNPLITPRPVEVVWRRVTVPVTPVVEPQSEPQPEADREQSLLDSDALVD
jgi:hypothetical protein